MTQSLAQTFDIDGVIEAERRRCAALEQDDLASLDKLLSPDLTHTHARGNIDDRDSYLAYIRDKVEFVRCSRGQLAVRIVDTVAVMTGPMENVVRMRGQPEEYITSAQALQVWRWHDARWLLIAFQATPLK